MGICPMRTEAVDCDGGVGWDIGWREHVGRTDHFDEVRPFAEMKSLLRMPEPT